MIAPTVIGHVHSSSQHTQVSLVSKLRKARAVSRATAQPLENVGRAERSQLERLIRDGVIVQAVADTYYVDEAAWMARRSEHQRLALLILVAIVTASMAGVFIGVALPV